jgi:long-chain fatty acid transport protein
MRNNLLLCLLALLLARPAAGVGIRLLNQGADAVARGNAFVATADDPSALFYNPAGITQLEGHHIQPGAYLIYLDNR